jgi:hypothetical protein
MGEMYATGFRHYPIALQNNLINWYQYHLSCSWPSNLDKKKWFRAKRIAEFRTLQGKAMRVVLKKGESRVKIIRMQVGTKGYAVSFEGLIGFITNLPHSNEMFGQAL